MMKMYEMLFIGNEEEWEIKKEKRKNNLIM